VTIQGELELLILLSKKQSIWKECWNPNPCEEDEIRENSSENVIVPNESKI
jgi:hypothetical protein